MPYLQRWLVRTMYMMDVCTTLFWGGEQTFWVVAWSNVKDISDLPNKVYVKVSF